MKILDLGLKAILEEQREPLLESLLAGGIDLKSGKWDHVKVVYNSKVSADILLAHAQREGIQYLYNILDGLKRGEYLSVMAYIYAVAECSHRLPPHGIIQHAIDEKLLEEYCNLLKVILPVYIDVFQKHN